MFDMGKYFTGRNVQRGEHRTRSMSNILIRPGSSVSRNNRQHRLCAIKRLYSGFLINAQDNGILWWIHVKTNDIQKLVLKLRIWTEGESSDAMRVQIMLDQNFMNRCRWHM